MTTSYVNFNMIVIDVMKSYNYFETEILQRSNIEFKAFVTTVLIVVCILRDR